MEKMFGEPIVQVWQRLNGKRVRAALLLVCLFGVLFLIACPSGPPGPQPLDFCQGQDDCASSQKCLNSVCVAKTQDGKLPWQEPIDASEPPPDAVGEVTPEGPRETIPEIPTGCVVGTKRACKTGAPGACAQGQQACDVGEQGVGVWGTCKAEPTKETCNGIDDDCNGSIDDNLQDEGTPCEIDANKGPCAKGTQVCKEGRLICEASSSPGVEVCDGQDNNCDGDIDEGCECIPGQEQPCYTGGKAECRDVPNKDCVGACKTGVSKCDSNGTWGECVGEVNPVVETCNGKDDDCDGNVDEDLSRGCYSGPANTKGVGLCKAGTQKCSNGTWGICQGEVTPAQERCDGQDNNCNGKADEAFINKGKACQQGVGACERKGTFVCNPTGDGTDCNATPGPVRKEICNGKDDNCNGQVDENFPKKGGPCSVGLGLCKRTGSFVCARGGLSLTCDAKPGQPRNEACDGVDNNCDGKTDEGCTCITGRTQACFTGTPSQRKVGECKDGQQVCNSSGKWGDCQGEVTPTDEICNGKDDNCDGKIDGNTRACYSGTAGCSKRTKPNGEVVYDCKGTCHTGKQTCTNKVWGACSGDTGPTTEICDGKDNDCDGKPDENWPDLGKECFEGKGICKRRSKFKCLSDGTRPYCPAIPGAPATEVCDNLDNDCDGQIDNGVSRRCGSDVGECQKGTQTCSGGRWSTTCAGMIGPQTESCDGKDNDCDGRVDEICGAQISYALLKSDATVTRARGFSRTASTPATGQYIVDSGSSSFTCTNRVIIATPRSAGAAAATYVCSGNKWKIYTFEAKTGALQAAAVPLHVVRTHASTYARVECQSAGSTCAVKTPKAGFPITIQASTIGRVIIAADPCKSLGQPIFAMLNGTKAGYIRTRSLGLNQAINKGLCEIRTFDARGNAATRNFVLWLPSRTGFTWATTNDQHSVEHQTYNFALNKPIYKEKWTISPIFGIQTFDYFTALFPAWRNPSAVMLTSRLKKPTVPATPPLAATSTFDNLGTSPNLRVYSHSFSQAGGTHAKTPLPFHIMYIDTQ